MSDHAESTAADFPCEVLLITHPQLGAVMAEVTKLNNVGREELINEASRLLQEARPETRPQGGAAVHLMTMPLWIYHSLPPGQGFLVKPDPPMTALHGVHRERLAAAAGVLSGSALPSPAPTAEREEPEPAESGCLDCDWMGRAGEFCPKCQGSLTVPADSPLLSPAPEAPQERPAAPPGACVKCCEPATSTAVHEGEEVPLCQSCAWEAANYGVEVSAPEAPPEPQGREGEDIVDRLLSRETA